MNVVTDLVGTIITYSVWHDEKQSYQPTNTRLKIRAVYPDNWVLVENLTTHLLLPFDLTKNPVTIVHKQ